MATYATRTRNAEWDRARSRFVHHKPDGLAEASDPAGRALALPFASMTFRDEATALRARIEALEAQVARLEQENARLRGEPDPDLAAVARIHVARLDALCESLVARGERVRSRESYTLERAGYDGFYATGAAGTAFLAVHPRALGLGLGPFLVQLRTDLPTMRARLEPRWRVKDKALLGWGDGPFVDLDVPPGLDREAEVAWLIDEVDSIREAFRDGVHGPDTGS